MSQLFFSHIQRAKIDPIFGLGQAFKDDPRPGKIDLSLGYYRDHELKVPIMKAIKGAEEELFKLETNKEYLAIDGSWPFISGIGEMVFGEFFWKAEGIRIFGAQTVGGTGGLRVAGEFIKQFVGKKIALPDPTWLNHRAIFQHVGLEVAFYPYYDFQNHKIKSEACFDYLRKLTPGSAVLFHASCHNPTGADFSLDEWKELSKICLEKGLLPFFDIAYQGLGRGINEDAEAVRLFANAGHEMVVASSQSKNFGLYGERVGALFVVVGNQESEEKMASQLKIIMRSNYSNPPRHGAKIVEIVLKSKELKNLWEEELSQMRLRMKNMKELFVQKIKKRDFRFLNHRLGLFCYTGIKESEVERLRVEKGIYMISDGRINVTGLTEKNIDMVTHAIEQVL
jgi:aspartate/tyrosine/aromatic aminotransferase